MLLFDTTPLPRADRAEAFRAAMQEASAACRVEHGEEPAAMQARMQLFPYGTAALLATDATRFRMVRTARHVARDDAAVVCLAFQHRGRGEFAQLGHEQHVRDGDLMLVDTTAPYGFGCATGGGSRALLVPLDQLGLPVDVVRRATPRLRASPLHDLVRAHLQRIADDAPELSADPGAAALGAATVELVRALVVSAAGDGRHGPGVREDTLVTRVRAHVARHLTDPGLTPAAVARAHGVSVRQLYKALAAAGVSLEQEVITQRLEAARSRLSSPAGRRRSVAAVARACGFTDPSHFARRFRGAYGVSPREWQRAAGGH
ncbi:AraC-like DNA-binding protein [Geodermatophilus normandii]|uniref:AraC-like DNA-binding protein n=1 Tax=Geodermatophilus normandii TaxID=1137989 RepID=A0A317QPR7_9ACTN|nr:helix-turn-helix domain-containing protein [Geodermatophilus normandii]PWW24867.1 AraC-like DNA-binding protein [Geodermatophilus normandii]